MADKESNYYFLDSKGLISSFVINNRCIAMANIFPGIMLTKFYGKRYKIMSP